MGTKGYTRAQEQGPQAGAQWLVYCLASHGGLPKHPGRRGGVGRGDRTLASSPKQVVSLAEVFTRQEG